MESDEEVQKSAALVLKKRDDADDKKRLNDDLVVFMRKRSESDAPRYTARLKTYVDFQEKRRRAAAARKRSEYAQITRPKKKDYKEKTDDRDHQEGDVVRRGRCEHPKTLHHSCSIFSRSPRLLMMPAGDAGRVVGVVAAAVAVVAAAAVAAAGAAVAVAAVDVLAAVAVAVDVAVAAAAVDDADVKPKPLIHKK